jgi:hypothetical protein
LAFLVFCVKKATFGSRIIFYQRNTYHVRRQKLMLGDNFTWAARAKIAFENFATFSVCPIVLRSFPSGRASTLAAASFRTAQTAFAP